MILINIVFIASFIFMEIVYRISKHRDKEDMRGFVEDGEHYVVTICATMRFVYILGVFLFLFFDVFSYGGLKLV